MSLFGHHHDAPTFASRAFDAGMAIIHLPLAVWLTIIPIAGGLAIAYVTHRLNVSRDRLALRRAEERQRADDERAATRVRADLAFRLSRHREAIRAAARGDSAHFAADHEALVRRCTKADVIDLLGKRYPAFMVILQREEATLGKLRADEPVAAEARRALIELEAAFETYVEQLSFTDELRPVRSSR